MKLAKRKLPAEIEGQPVSLLPEDPEDMVRLNAFPFSALALSQTNLSNLDPTMSQPS